MRGLNGVVRVALTEQVRFRQRCEGGEGELAKWPCRERARAKDLRQKMPDMYEEQEESW